MPSSLKFFPEVINAATGEEFVTSILIDTGGEETGGAGARFYFDPTLVEVVKIETGDIYNDYPSAAYDNQQGRVVISGIVAGVNDLYTGTGTFAKVTWRALSPGQGYAQFEFVEGSTADSNIAILTGNGDTLDEVNSLSMNITGQTVERSVPLATPKTTETAIGGTTPSDTTQTGTTETTPVQTTQTTPAPESQSFVGKITSAITSVIPGAKRFQQAEVEEFTNAADSNFQDQVAKDPLAPLPAGETKTVINQETETTAVQVPTEGMQEEPSGGSPLVLLTLLLFVVIVIGAAVVVLSKKRKKKGPQAPSPEVVKL